MRRRGGWEWIPVGPDVFDRNSSPQPPRSLRDASGYLPASVEVAWLAGERRANEVQYPKQVEGAVADSNGPGQDREIEEPHTGEW